MKTVNTVKGLDCAARQLRQHNPAYKCVRLTKTNKKCCHSDAANTFVSAVRFGLHTIAAEFFHSPRPYAACVLIDTHSFSITTFVQIIPRNMRRRHKLGLFSEINWYI